MAVLTDAAIAPSESRLTAVDNETDLLLALCRWIADGDSLTGSLVTGSRAVDAETVRIIGYHGLKPALYAALKAASGDTPNLMDDLKRAYFAQAARSVRAMEQVAEVGRVFNEACIPFILLKGNATVLSVHRDPALRRVSDIDVLVREDDVDRAIAALQSARFEKIDICRSDAEEWINIRYLGGVTLRRASTLSVEIHTSLLHGHGDRDTSVQDIWGAAAPTDMGGWTAWTVPPAIAYISAAVHLYSDSTRSVPAYKDVVDLLLLARRIESDSDWASVERCTERWNLPTIVRPVGAFLNRYLDGRVPGCRDDRPFMSATALTHQPTHLRGQGRIIDGLAIRLRFVRMLPNRWARVRFYIGVVLPHPGYLRWRFGVAPNRPIWPYYLRHIVRGGYRLVRDAGVKAGWRWRRRD
ncbi:MAG: nucleotidyltransferase family protein [Chthonomonadales bacterium]|nr:nucleotidyltransferase family protein [Chthonomonadales bacterium]